jgi:hypothetical protein
MKKGMVISMEANNILSGGIEQLNEIKDYLLELNGNIANSKLQKDEAEKLEKAVRNLEKDITEEIQLTIKKRRGEIEDTFDQQISKLRDRARKIKEQRNKAKSSKISERIDAETAPLRMENNSLRLEAETIARQEKLPFFCNTKLYLALYYPSCFTDILIIFAALAIILLLIPCSIYFLVLPVEKIIYMVLTYVVTVLVFGSIYLSIGNYTKDKYWAKILQIREIRGHIRGNGKKISGIRKRIKKDRDESGYGLQGYDEELAALEKEEDDILAQKKDALTVFENETSRIITTEIQDSYKDKLSELKSEHERIKSSLTQTEEKIKALTIKIAGDYEPFLGKDLMTLDRLEALSNIILAGNAATISEAIAFYRQNTIPEKVNADD